MVNSDAYSPIHENFGMSDFGEWTYSTYVGYCDGGYNVLGMGAPCAVWFVGDANQIRIDPSHNYTPHLMSIADVPCHPSYALDRGQDQPDRDALRRTTPDLMDP